ncbi:MAG: hypothetical protein QM770_20760 [Tepidisphaeraceae bacterium]
MSPSHTLLITGFGPFPGVSANVSGSLVAALNPLAARRHPRLRIVTEVLPVEWYAGPRALESAYMRQRPDIAIHFGVSRHARGFVIECEARNECRDLPDAAGARPLAPRLAQDGPDRLASTFPANDIVCRLERAGIRASLSRDAGAYLCNAILFRSLQLAADEASGAVVGFVHVPTDIPIHAVADGLTWRKRSRAAMQSSMPASDG